MGRHHLQVPRLQAVQAEGGPRFTREERRCSRKSLAEKSLAEMEEVGGGEAGAGSSAAAAAAEEEEEPYDIIFEEWAQCDQCNMWRPFPSREAAGLPEGEIPEDLKWYCSMAKSCFPPPAPQMERWRCPTMPHNQKPAARVRMLQPKQKVVRMPQQRPLLPPPPPQPHPQPVWRSAVDPQSGRQFYWLTARPAETVTWIHPIAPSQLAVAGRVLLPTMLHPTLQPGHVLLPPRLPNNAPTFAVAHAIPITPPASQQQLLPNQQQMPLASAALSKERIKQIHLAFNAASSIEEVEKLEKELAEGSPALYSALSNEQQQQQGLPASAAPTSTAAPTLPEAVPQQGHEAATVATEAPEPPDAAAEARGAQESATAAALRSRYEANAAAFEPLTASNIREKMVNFSESLEAIYGELPFLQNDWGTSILGTLVGLVCAQTCKNSWSSVGYANLAATFPTESGEPNWDLIRTRKLEDIVPCIWHGPYFYRKAERIMSLLQRAYDDSGDAASTSLEHLHNWPSSKVRSYLMDFNGISGKSVACLLLYRMGRVDFAVDANVLRVMTRLGWLKSCGIYATEGISATDRRSAMKAGAILPFVPPPRSHYSEHAYIVRAALGQNGGQQYASPTRPPRMLKPAKRKQPPAHSSTAATAARGKRLVALRLSIGEGGLVSVGLQIPSREASEDQRR